MPRTTVTFRDEDLKVEYTANEEPDVNAYELEWHFVDLDADGHKALGITDEEDEEITQLLWQHYEELCSAQDYD
jgi:hypothetical protein